MQRPTPLSTISELDDSNDDLFFTSPPDNLLPSTPSPVLEEDDTIFTNIKVSSNSLSSITFSSDPDPLAWMKQSCSNEASVLTYLDFQDFEKLDLINIRFLKHNQNTFQEDTQCISRQELIEWISSDINVLPPTNIMSIYTSPSDPSPSNLETGFTSKPTKRYIIRLPPSNFYITLGSAQRIFNEPHREWFALPLFGGKRRRIGNIFGYYGSSMNHGQVPGEIIYKLFSLNEIQNSVIVKETLDDYPIPFDISITDISSPFLPTDDYLSSIYGENSTIPFLKSIFTEMFSRYIHRTRFSNPYSLINTLSFETQLSIDLLTQIFSKNPLINIDTQNTKGYTALMIALINKLNNISDDIYQLVISFLLSKSPNVDIQNDDDLSTSVMYAFSKQKLYDPLLLLQFVSLSKNFSLTDKDGWDASMFAFNSDFIYQFSDDLILAILSKLTNINRQERKFGWSPLMILFKNTSPKLSNKSIISRIFSMNPDFNLQNKRGKNAFMYAAFNYNKSIHYSVFNRILSLQPNLNLQSLIGETVLSISLSSPYVSNNFILLLLQSSSLNINTSLSLDNSIFLDDDDSPSYDSDLFNGYSPLMIALENPRVHHSVILKLLSLNPNINHTNSFNETALMLSLINRSKHITDDIILSILKLNPFINSQDSQGYTALSLALSNFSGLISESIVLTLLDLSPDINLTVTDEHISPLMIALFNNSGTITPSIVYKLLSLNPNLNYVSQSGFNILTVSINTLSRDDPSLFIPPSLLDYLLTLPLDYSTLSPSITLSLINDLSKTFPIRFPNHYIQYKPILDTLLQKLSPFSS